jgi:hypothetical protein
MVFVEPSVGVGAAAAAGWPERQAERPARFAMGSDDRAVFLHVDGRVDRSSWFLGACRGCRGADGLPGAVVVAAVGLVALRWALSLPEQTRNAFIIAGIVYVAGGLGFELIGSQVADETFLNPAYLLASGLEETLEMCGVVIMLVGVVMHLQAMDWVMDRGRPDAAEDDPVMYDPVTADS